MKHLLLTLFAIITIQLSAQKTLLYEISGNGLSKPSYIYGTIHMICENDFILKESVKSKLNESEQIVLEIDMDDPQLTKKTIELMSFKKGESLKNVMNEADYNSLSKFFKDSLSMSLTMFERFKPLFLFSLLSTKMLACDLKSYETEFVKIASSQKKELLGLETIEFQVSVFDKMSKDDMSKMLGSIVTDYSKMKTEFDEMIEHYKQQDIDKLYDDINKSSMSGFNGYSKDFLDNRNIDWISKISKFSSEKSTFYGVGAGHLAGENGVLNLLKKAGFTITPIE
jgi:uncharacterized protein